MYRRSILWKTVKKLQTSLPWSDLASMKQIKQIIYIQWDSTGRYTIGQQNYTDYLCAITITLTKIEQQ